MDETGIPDTVADAVSATRGGVLGVNQRVSRWPEQVRAMQLWGRLLAAALDGGAADANVVPMAAAPVECCVRPTILRPVHEGIKVATG